MKKPKIDTMTTDQLVAHFEELCVAQYYAREHDEVAVYSRLFR